jgi:site-specific recombinase XerD
MSYCTTRRIEPADVTAEVFAAFGAELESNSLSRDPGGVYHDSCKLWNRAADIIADWPKIKIEVPLRRHDFALPMTAFPDSFRVDLERFLMRTTELDIFSDDYCKPVRRLTISNWRQHVLMAATALVRSGFLVAQVTDLGVLVDSDNAKNALRFLHKRNNGTSGYLYHIATTLKTIARHHVRDETTVEQLRGLCRALKPQTRGMTEKNKAFLRQFADQRKLAALLTMPQRLIGASQRRGVVRRRDAVKIELAVAVAIELVMPIRVDNLAGLRLDRHLHFVGDHAFLSIPAEETKNGEAIEAELPSSLAHLLHSYLDKVRPLLTSSPSPWLFPGEQGARRRSGGFGTQLSSFIAKEAGVIMTPHQFRHLAAKLYLDRNPDGVETVRRLLGHKSIETTLRFYRELESVVATKRYGEFVEQLLADAQVKTAIAVRRPHRRLTEET